MTVKTQGFGLKTVSPVQRVYSGRFTGINGAAPTSYVLDNGIAVTRSGEGVYVVTLPSPMKAFKSVGCWVNDTGEFHEVSWALSNSARTITITHKTCAYADIATGPAAEDVVADINFVAVVEIADIPGSGV
jgi:hypothetical protein